MEIRVKLDQLLKDRNITQTQLKELIDQEYYKNEDKKVRQAAISELYNNQRKSLNKELIEAVITVLDLKEPNEIFEFINRNNRQS